MPYTEITWATFRTRLLERVDTSAHWTNAEALIVTNDLLALWNLLTGTWRDEIPLTIQPGGDPYVALPGTLTWPFRMEIAASGGSPVERTSIAVLDNALPGWEGEQIGDTGVPASIQYWAARSLELVAIWPRVLVATAVTFDGLSDTPVLVNDGDFIDLDEGLHDIFLAAGAHWLQWKDGGPKFFGTIGAYNALILAAAEENAAIKSTDIYRHAAGLDTDQRHRPRRRIGPDEQGLARRAAGQSQ